jgi:hypothetical protein
MNRGDVAISRIAEPFPKRKRGHRACLDFLPICDFSWLRNKLCLSLLAQT